MRRRRFLRSSLVGGGAFVLGCSDDGRPMLVDAGPDGGADAGADAARDAGADAGGPACADPFASATMVAAVDFVGEGSVPLDTPFNVGWDGRLYTDLRRLERDALIVPSDRFYIRTRYPDLLDPSAPWVIAIGGLVEAPVDLGLADLDPLVRDQGVHLMECSGNSIGGGFGLLSAAEWSGAPIMDVLARARPLPAATRVLVEGFDMHSVPSEGGHSRPGASWIFTLDDLTRAGAFLATRMNGEALPPDHGAPVRLLVPGWYGCTCIKWVNRIELVDDDADATAQMQEFASRTHQSGTPLLARDYIPAVIDQTAMPVRVEKWRLEGGAVGYRVIGVMWGGNVTTDALSIRFGAEPFVPVDVCPAPVTNRTWTIWEHLWQPATTGVHEIALRIDDRSIRTRRLDSGYYVREVDIDEV